MNARLLIISLSIGLLASCNSTTVTPDHSLPEGIRVLADMKSQCQQWTRTLKKDHAVGSPEYKKAEALYIPAKAAMDGWIAELKATLILNNSADASQYQQSLNQAASKANDYVVYVNQLYVQGAAAALALPLIGDFLKLLPDMGFKIWKEYRDSASKNEENRKKQIIEHLETLKWDFFDKV